jgi:hypothetical protein
MDALIDRQKVVAAIEKLPPDALMELSHFIEYLQCKTAGSPEPTEEKSSSFLFAITDKSDRNHRLLQLAISN